MSDSDRVFGMFGSNTMIESNGANGDETGNQIFGAAKTPQYIIKAEGIFHSLMKPVDSSDYTAYAPCLWFELGTSRLATFDSTSFFTGDGRVVAKTTTVCMKYGPWGPALLQYLTCGDIIDDIIIKRLCYVQEKPVELQATTFFRSIVTKYEQRGDKIFFAFAFDEMMDEAAAIDNSGKRQGGVSGFQYSFTNLRNDLYKGGDGVNIDAGGGES